MRTEDDLRAVFTALEREAPNAARVLPAADGGRQARKIRPGWRPVLAVLLAAGVTAGVIVAVLPSSPPPLTVQLLADRAAAAARSSPDVSAGQWVYELSDNSTPFHQTFKQAGWMTADGTLSYGAGSIGDPIFPYGQLNSLPRDPAQLNAYFVSLDPVKTDNKSVVEFSQIESMLFGMVLPPWLQAEMFQALALIPTIQVKDHVKDIAGRAGVSFVLPPTKQSEQLEIILDASDYHLLARGSWDNPSTPAPDSETAILTEYLVAELGSTQPSATAPNAAEVAAERIDHALSYSSKPPQIRSVAADQWLYRELSTGGQDRQIWATADDSEQAEYVNGTLQVCQRADSCAASQQWLMPAGPSYSLVYPPQPTAAQIKQYRQDVKDHLKATNPFKADMAQPTLPSYPGPLLAKLNTYSTGCTDVAGDCNAVNVIANMLTGYGDYPSPISTWFYVLADIPGVSVQNVTDAAGQQDLAFTFPAQDGVTAILVNARQLKAGTVQYAGYIKDGQQTLVVSQALVKGPGVRP